MNTIIQAERPQTLAQEGLRNNSDQTQYLTFMSAGEVFAIGILAIKEIIEYSGLTVVPMMPECVRGVINLRGAAVPVMDLQVRFGKGVTQIGRRSCIVIVEVDADGVRRDVGVMVDAVNEVLEIPLSEIEPAPTFGAKINTNFIEGMGKVDGHFVILLNVNHVLSVKDMGGLVEVIKDSPFEVLEASDS